MSDYKKKYEDLLECYYKVGGMVEELREENAKLKKSKEELDKAYITILAALENGSDETIWPSGMWWYDAAAKIINEEKYSFIDRNMERREKEGVHFPTREEALEILRKGGARKDVE